MQSYSRNGLDRPAPLESSDVEPGGGQIEPVSSLALERAVLRRLLKYFGMTNVAVSLWDGATVGSAQAEVRVELRDRGALYQLLRRPELQFGLLYTEDRLRVSGSLVDAMASLYRAMAGAERDRRFLWPGTRLRRSRAPRINSLARAQSNIHAHYDIGNDFYELWLDRAYQQYTCAYYATAECTLEQAQAAKLEHVARKLNLQPGERVLETGGGWGGLARYLARQYGVRVSSYNISAEQIRYARERAEREGLANVIEYVHDDYRHAQGQFDAFVSVGMLEHVGTAHYRALGQVIDRCLTPMGRGLIHSIAQRAPRRLNPWIERTIFPGAYAPTLPQMMRIIEPFGFEVWDVENLRPHYARTLRDWRTRFEQQAETVRSRFDPGFERTWRLYLAGSEAAFTEGGLQLYQVLFARPGSTSVPATRAHLYRAPDAAI